LIIHSIAVGLAAISWFAPSYEMHDRTFILMMPMFIMDYPLLRPSIWIRNASDSTTQFVATGFVGGAMWFGIGVALVLAIRFYKRSKAI
jgi:hypothetical protein